MTNAVKQYLTRAEAAEYVTSLGLPLSKNTLQKWATTGGGPRYSRFGHRAVYVRKDLDEWVSRRIGTPVESSSAIPSEQGG